jgi:hypothetical protein
MGARSQKKILIFLYIIIIISILYLYFSYRYYNHVEGFDDMYELPKTIWTFWDSDEQPPLIKDIQNHNKKILKEWKYNLVTNSNLYNYIPKEIFPKNYESLQPSFKSDWIRLFLLKTYGGCWLDASIFINNQSELNKLYDESLSKKSHLTCFILDTKKKHEELDIPLSIESWFIIAPKNGSVITAWFNEFNKAVEIGFLPYKKQIIKEKIDISEIGLGYPQKEDEVYLTVFACLNKALQKVINPLPPLIFKDANETMFKLHYECKFNNVCVMNKIKNDKNVKYIPYIKLVGADRHTNIDISDYFKNF